MKKQRFDAHFYFHVYFFKLRDFLFPRKSVLLEEFNRVLKCGGILSFHDHKMSDRKAAEEVIKSGLFNLAKKSENTFAFQKAET